tara:strand:+ start:37 stop:489 length:453 start_codon:yes stop_codon:yes gene_type:complete
MNKKKLLYICLLIILSNCQRHEVINTHGITYLEQREKLIVINESNKNDAIKVLGHPATKGMSDENLWIYIERTKTKGKLLKLGRSNLEKNNVLVLEFDYSGILTNKKFYDKENMQRISFVKGLTENEIKRENFIYSFLSSIRQKMQSKRK